MLHTTLCYIEKGNKYLMLHRTKKEKDCNRDKWIGIGGKLEKGETPKQCILREAKEETGLSLISPEYRGIVYFISDKYENECMHLFKAKQFVGTLTECDEGDLEWIEKRRLRDMTVWEGDKLFLELLETDCDFFNMALNYEGEKLVSHAVNFEKSNERPTVLLSACILGADCKYNGGNNYRDGIFDLFTKYNVIPICPETAGGLVRPREPSEKVGNRVLSKSGKDVTAEFKKGADVTLEIAKNHNAVYAVLKAKSPSCGCGVIYDGSFTGNVIPGNGVTAELLLKCGIKIYNETNWRSLL